ncbi:DUF383-domain-containing protein [Aureobasidium sp. EXF-3400]|nr:DUF383-domain-containing protein [Aureobasidium sp. EXF-12344]KAI4774151.1 DUF383-domain-containing protein [Aureobasidium sp. EXF-3400]
MPTELEEQEITADTIPTAAENLVGFSTAQPSLFKYQDLRPVTDMKLLVRDYAPIAKNVLTILVNISSDEEVLKYLAEDDVFLETLYSRITNTKEENADEMSMLLANLTKHDHLKTLLTLKRDIPKPLSTSPFAIDQLLDLFVKGQEGSYNEKANFDYLCYVFADISKYEEGRKHFLTPREEDENIIPLTKLIVFTEHKSTIRRRGVASTIKNAAFDTDAHETMLSTDESSGGLNILPYLLLPLMGPEEYDDKDMETMPEELQLLPPDKTREPETDIQIIHLETLLLLTTARVGRDFMREKNVYAVMRELHLHTDSPDVQEACDRVVQIIARDEEGEGEDAPQPPKVQEIDDEDELVEVA